MLHDKTINIELTVVISINININDIYKLYNCGSCPGHMAQLVGAPSCTPKDFGFDPQSGYISRLQVWSPVRTHTGGNQLIFLSHINLSLSPPSSLFKINNEKTYISLDEDWKKYGIFSRRKNIVARCYLYL